MAKNDSFHSAVDAAKQGKFAFNEDTWKAFQGAKKEVREKEKNKSENNRETGEEVVVVPLGTGSSLPTKHRNGVVPFRLILACAF